MSFVALLSATFLTPFKEMQVKQLGYTLLWFELLMFRCMQFFSVNALEPSLHTHTEQRDKVDGNIVFLIIGKELKSRVDYICNSHQQEKTKEHKDVWHSLVLPFHVIPSSFLLVSHL